jgi:hypothetical protein
MLPKRPNISGKNCQILKTLAISGLDITPSKRLAIHRFMYKFGFRLGDNPAEKNTDFILISDTELFGLELKKENLSGVGSAIKERCVYAIIN